MFDPWVGKIPWRRKWQPASIFLPGKSQVQRKLEDYSGWCCKELDSTEHAHILGHFFLHGKVKHTGLPLNTVFQGFSEMHAQDFLSTLSFRVSLRCTVSKQQWACRHNESPYTRTRPQFFLLC